MGWKTDLSAKAGALRYAEDARRAFAEVRRQADYAVRNLPSNRDLLTYAQHHHFGARAAA
ncbi:hypothetical protein [Sphingomonas sp. Ant20]|nr:hypothetical protein [Sphingomonas sp. Ant20]